MAIFSSWQMTGTMAAPSNPENLMNRFRLPFLVATALLCACGRSEQTLELPAGQQELPSQMLTDRSYWNLDGSPLDTQSLLGQDVLVNYWATWCAPCIRELPSLIAAAEQLDGEAVILLASDETLADIDAFLATHGFAPGHFVRLEGNFSLNYINAIPSTDLYAPDGTRTGNWLGAFEWDSPAILSELRDLMQ